MLNHKWDEIYFIFKITIEKINQLTTELPNKELTAREARKTEDKKHNDDNEELPAQPNNQMSHKLSLRLIWFKIVMPNFIQIPFYRFFE